MVFIQCQIEIILLYIQNLIKNNSLRARTKLSTIVKVDTIDTLFEFLRIIVFKKIRMSSLMSHILQLNLYFSKH